MPRNPRPCWACGRPESAHGKRAIYTPAPRKEPLRARRVPTGVSAWTPRDGAWVPVHALRDFLSAEAEKVGRIRPVIGSFDESCYWDGVLDGLDKVRERFAIEPECRS